MTRMEGVPHRETDTINECDRSVVCEGVEPCVDRRLTIDFDFARILKIDAPRRVVSVKPRIAFAASITCERRQLIGAQVVGR